MKKVLAMLVAVCAMSMSTVVYAQEQCPDAKRMDKKELKERHVMKMKKELNLSDEQMAQMKAANEEFDAAVKAVEAVDTCVGKVVDAVTSKGGVTLITADHGNADKMFEPDGSPFTAHTTNPVPFVVVGCDCSLKENGGKLCDIAPTMLQIMGLEQPAQMTGTSLIK